MRYVEVTTPKLLASRCGSRDASWCSAIGTRAANFLDRFLDWNMDDAAELADILFDTSDAHEHGCAPGRNFSIFLCNRRDQTSHILLGPRLLACERSKFGPTPVMARHTEKDRAARA